jgi:SOS-response transcriptional repressor LexA
MITTSKGTTNGAFALSVEDEVDSRFPKGTLLVVEPTKKPKNRDYIIVQQLDHQVATFKRYILDGEIAYLKPIDPDFKTVEYTNEYKIIGIVIQSIFDFN